jgi:hypothetical protein
MARQRVKASRQNKDAETQSISDLPAATGRSSSKTMRGHAHNGALSPDTKRRIEELAYEFYQQRGCRHGDDWKDWLEAERLTIAAQEAAD